jgi:prepilin-type N-terminal cleavage/methylation domain-containing protein
MKNEETPSDAVATMIFPSRSSILDPRSSSPARHGFTLIELMVVVFIIGILVALTVVAIPKVQRAVYGAQTNAQLSALANAIHQYYGDFKSYPGPLANNQLGIGNYNASAPIPTADTFSLSYYSPTGWNPNYIPSTIATYGYLHISGSQNLTLGLLGGLDLNLSTGQFWYNPQDITSDGVTTAPRGPASLNPTTPRRYQAYIQVKSGDLSIPQLSYNSTNGASFADSAGRSPTDAMIPVFLDKYSEPLPILYFRTNVGAQAIVGLNNLDSSGNALVDPITSQKVTAQYDVLQVWDYTHSRIGTIASNPNSLHGLQNVDQNNPSMNDPIMAAPPNSTAPYGNGANAIAYLRDPSSYDPSSTTTYNTHGGVPRQKDGFLLISAGPDRLYGTTDDNIFPGSVLVSQ